MTSRISPRRFLAIAFVLALFTTQVPRAQAAAPPKVYVILWFDTEDYLLPASDDAALHLANFLTQEEIRATFKVVGEKARTLERRGRTDVISALKKHEIGFHANYHSVEPTPAVYLSNLGWDDGVEEFDRRERPGFDDVQRIFGVAPSCYGQPGSSWGPQSYGAMRRWGMQVYLDSGNHVRLDDRPFYYCGILNLYRLAYTLRADLKNRGALPEAEKSFEDARRQLLKDGGGVVSIFYHPCEFTHREFWDGVNFRLGANPPRAQWKAPPAQTTEETQAKFRVFENYIRFIKRFPDVQFITASEAARLYRDRAHGRRFTLAELRTVARGVTENVTYQQHRDYTLAPSEVFALLNQYVAARAAGRHPDTLALKATEDGPCNPGTTLSGPVHTDWSQLGRTAIDMDDFLARQKRVPTSVWLGSLSVPPESYVEALARVTLDLLDGKEPPATIEVRPARLATAANVARDNPRLWGWIIFPPNFHAPALMELARREAWTLKPALLHTPDQ